jgi:hypothetical protein
MSVAEWAVAPDDPVVVNPDPTWNKTPTTLAANTIGLTVNGTVVVQIPVSGNAGIEDLDRSLQRLVAFTQAVVWDNLFPGWNGASFG